MTDHVIDFHRHRAKVRREAAVERSRRLTKAFANKREPAPSLKETMADVQHHLAAFVRGC